MNIAVILAGGVGNRLGGAVPKQFLKLAGKSVLEHTVDVFNNHPLIDEIVIVSNSMYINNVEQLLINNKWLKVKKIISGGKERYESSLSAIKSYEDSKPNLIFHDSVRPLINARIITEVIQSLESYNAVDVAIDSVDTIIEVENNEIINIPNRSKLKRGQTPQAFKFDTISKAYELALKDPNFVTTDDCGVVHKYLPNEPIFVVVGEEVNMKLTYHIDTFLLDKLFQLNSISSSSNSKNYDLLANKVVVVFGASSGIGESIVEKLNIHKSKVYGYSKTLNNVNIGNFVDVVNALDKVFTKEGRIDYIINTAGVLYKIPLVNMNEDEIDDIISTNYRGMVNVARASHQYLKFSKGQLLLFTSSSYTRGRAMYSMYSSSKSAVVNFVQAIAQEWEIDQVRVNCINPERTSTPMRTKNFGIEPEGTLLSSEIVAQSSIDVLLSDFSGQVVDVKR